MYPLGFTYTTPNSIFVGLPMLYISSSPFTNYCNTICIYCNVSILYNVEKNTLAHVFSILLSFKRNLSSQWNQWTRSGWLTELPHMLSTRSV